MAAKLCDCIFYVGFGTALWITANNSLDFRGRYALGARLVDMVWLPQTELDSLRPATLEISSYISGYICNQSMASLQVQDEFNLDGQYPGSLNMVDSVSELYEWMNVRKTGTRAKAALRSHLLRYA